MKMKAVCEATGLTRKTILFYEEQGFIAPEKTRINQRDYREYTEQDILTLMDIAALRKCCFSIEEIKQMHSAPESVRKIFLDYKNRLLLQKAELNALLTTAENIPDDALNDLSSLLEILRTPSEALPLPHTDVEPHFLYLDDMEAALDPPEKPSKYHSDAQPISIDQDHIFMDVRYGKKKLLDDLKNDLDDIPHYGVPEPVGGPKWLGVIKGVAIIALILFFFNYIQATRWGAFSKPALISMAVMDGLVLLIIGISLLQKRLRKS